MKPMVFLQRAHAARPRQIYRYVGNDPPRARAHDDDAVRERDRLGEIVRHEYWPALLKRAQS
jgi:hypothetical protein